MRSTFHCSKCNLECSVPSDYAQEARRCHQRDFHPQGDELVLATWDDFLSGLILALLGVVMLLIAYLL
jgi:hypothetical protein